MKRAHGLKTGEQTTLLVVGGSDVRLRVEMVRRLSSRYDVHVAGSDCQAAAVFAQAGVTYHYYRLVRGVKPWHDLLTLISLTELFRRVRPDIVHTYDTKPSGIGRLAARLARVPTIVGTLPGMGSLYANDKVRTKLTRAAYERVQKSASRLSDLTIVQNGEDWKDVTDGGIVPVDKCVVLRGSGVDTTTFRPERLSSADAARVRASLGVADEVLVITMVARIIESKGVLDYAAVARRKEFESTGVCFLLVGSEDYMSSDRLSATELAMVRESVRWVGERTDIADVLAVSDVFVLPSYYMEGIPRVLLEAAASGLPIITTDVRGCREVVLDGVTGLLVGPRDQEGLADAIWKLMREDRRAALGGAARRHALDQFDMGRIVAETENLYDKAVKR